MSNIANARLQYTGLKVTEDAEGLRLVAYRPTPNDVWTIGYGHTSGVVQGMTCTQAQAQTWLLEDIAWAANAVKQYVNVALTQGEFNALVDFVFNEGVSAFAGSTLLKYLNAGNYLGAYNELSKWNIQAGHVLAGLIKRRADEQQEWNS